MWKRLRVKYPLSLSDFSETWIFSIGFGQKLRYRVSWKSFQWEPSCSMRTDRRKGMTKLIAAFCNFAKAPSQVLETYECANVTWTDLAEDKCCNDSNPSVLMKHNFYQPPGHRGVIV